MPSFAMRASARDSWTSPYQTPGLPTEATPVATPFLSICSTARAGVHSVMIAGGLSDVERMKSRFAANHFGG